MSSFPGIPNQKQRPDLNPAGMLDPGQLLAALQKSKSPTKGSIQRRRAVVTKEKINKKRW